MEDKKKKPEISLKDMMETEEYARNNAAIKMEINKNKVSINYDEFKKSEKEKQNLILAKLEYNNNKQESLLPAFQNAVLPNWGVLKVNGNKYSLIK